MSLLEKKLLATLKSRDVRQMRRKLPLTSETSLIDFSSNDYLSLSKCPDLRTAFIQKLQSSEEILGSGGSRLLINGSVHSSLEARLTRFLGTRTHEALLFNSGFDANVGFFSCVPQPRDVVVHDEYIHASVHDGMRTSRATPIAFAHNSVLDLERVLVRVRDEQPGAEAGRSVFIAVESLYSMDGTVPPLVEMVQLAESVFPGGNAHFVVDEAHSTGLYGPLGRGLVALLGLEDRIYARLHTFGKSLASSGAVMVVTPVVKDYLINYARPLIYTTSLSNSAIIQAGCSFDILDSGHAQKLSNYLLILSQHFTSLLKTRLNNLAIEIPPEILSLPPHLYDPNTLPSPIIPLLTASPRPLSTHLQAMGLNVRPITWPTVPKGKERVRICLHVGNTRADVELLVEGTMQWAVRAARHHRVGEKVEVNAVAVEAKL